MISIRELEYRYDGAHGISGVNLELAAGEACAIVGPSGCGKTTLLHVIAGHLAPSAGTVEIGSEGGAARIGLVQQNDALFPWMSVRRNTWLGIRRTNRRRLTRAARDALHERIEVLLDELGIPDTADRFPGQLSGGQRRRTAIARAMIDRPDILLLDEPSSSLDAFGKETLQTLLLELQRNHPVTTVLVTHDIEEALFLAPIVLIMRDGGIYSTHTNPVYPDPRARASNAFYAEVRRLRNALESARS